MPKDYSAQPTDEVCRDEQLKRAAVYKVVIDSWSGKRKQAADDFPGRISGNP